MPFCHPKWSQQQASKGKFPLISPLSQGNNDSCFRKLAVTLQFTSTFSGASHLHAPSERNVKEHLQEGNLYLELRSSPLMVLIRYLRGKGSGKEKRLGACIYWVAHQKSYWSGSSILNTFMFLTLRSLKVDTHEWLGGSLRSFFHFFQPSFSVCGLYVPRFKKAAAYVTCVSATRKMKYMQTSVYIFLARNRSLNQQWLQGMLGILFF